jgi:cell division septation protein DedD
MPHTMVTFRLHRSGVILLIVFGIVLAILIYVAGYMSALRVARSTAGVPSRPNVHAVVAPTQTVPSAPKSPPPSNEQRVTSEPLTLRIAVHTSEEDANAQIATLTGQGLQPAIVQASTTSGVTLHNIIVGRYETRDAANAAAAQLQRRLGFMPVIVPAPPL